MEVLVEFEKFLNANLPVVPSFHPHFEEALSLMLTAEAKRFRPALLLSVVKAYNPLLLNPANHVALAIEMLHTYSLIHDDLPSMDNASLRRNKPTLHKLYGETTAILVGDALNTEAFRVLADAPLSPETKIKLIRLLSLNGGACGMVLGQAIDCYFENQSLPIEKIKTLHAHKTAKLIAASLQMGAVIVGTDELERDLYEFGVDLGVLFQIQDDILDVTQSSSEALKTTNIDADKNSFVTILGFKTALNEADILADKLLLKVDSFDLQLREELEPLLVRYINRHRS